jgi:hypothetical protein
VAVSSRLDGGFSKKNENVAELSYWYGFDVGALPQQRQLGLQLNLNRVRMQQLLFNGTYDPNDPAKFQKMHRQAFGNEEATQQALIEFMRAKNRRDTSSGIRNVKQPSKGRHR